MENRILIDRYKPYNPVGMGNIIQNLSPFAFEKMLRLFTIAKDIRYKNITKRKALSLNLFGQIDIETINRCNGSCSFCPVNKNIDPRDFHLMDEELFHSIIDQLHEMGFSGGVYLSLNNEPLLDRRLFKFLEYARGKLPFAKLVIWTNGTLLTADKFHRLMYFLDSITIDNYNDNLELYPNIKEIYKICLNEEKYRDRIKIVLRKRNEILTSRAGQAKNRKKMDVLASPCMYPYCQMSVRPDGKVSMCCNDALGKVTLGDINKESILDIWNGDRYTHVRKEMLRGRKNLELCKNCDTIVL
jgi:radical SAM protein with 4Fe4S-binding SPASM domain